MTDTTREVELLRAFAGLADTLVAGYDVVDLMQRLVDTCRDLLPVTASGVLLADEAGELDLLASTSEASRLVEIFQISAYSGPCIESFATGRVVSLPDLARTPERWSMFRDKAMEEGFAAILAIPLRLRETTIGTLNLLRDTPGELPESDLVAAQAFADVATIGILHHRTLHESETIRAQLQTALNSRIVIEQAKGVVAQLHRITIDDAFTVMRDHARRSQEGLTAVAEAIVARRLVPPLPPGIPQRS
ncbi:GAF and ANTAR domain-containing protein [Leifsonia sp. C5G2]|uniref:GAF and ANTAR domain-containing protein n=1 Tax=Leifsonia sp. C5G2 TaxID=2735269 RepID=UPI0015854262|nr:GAF and ANTAR domain-containing protein [Leifsonia sp. C5G2]NUU07299.1 GAF and ANTAR domain-containing protein [Leifsonia sp. C5G2]